MTDVRKDCLHCLDEAFLKVLCWYSRLEIQMFDVKNICIYSMNILDAIKLPKNDPPHYYFDINKYLLTGSFQGFEFSYCKECY